MKTADEVNAIMQAIPVQWRARWCGGERGACACTGCVQIGNRAVIAEKITGRPYQGDPANISEEKLREHGSVYVDNKITHEEWKAWMAAHPEALAQSQRASGPLILENKAVQNAGPRGNPVSIENPPEYSGKWSQQSHKP